MIAADRTLLEQARELQALAQTGLAYCKDPFDRERYERIRAIAVDMLAMQADVPAEVREERDRLLRRAGDPGAQGEAATSRSGRCPPPYHWAPCRATASTSRAGPQLR